MKVRVQSKHLLDEQLLVKIWQRSEVAASDRHFPLGKEFGEWRSEPQTDLGSVSDDGLYFWMNWYAGIYQNDARLIPAMILEEPEEWRIVVNLDAAEKENLVVITEDESSVYVYRFDSEKLTRFRLVRKDGPRLIESRVDEIPEWLANKIAAAKEKLDPEALKGRLNDLSARLQQLKQRRIEYPPHESA